jgi:hypothetical protein
MTIPEEAARYRMAYLPPMSGLAAVEPKWEWGRVNVLLGEGQTAQVLRNLCLEVYEKDEDHVVWNQLADHMKDMFGAEPLPPEYIAERGEIVMAYKDHRGPVLDISAAGRGMQQTLLLLAYLYNNPQSVLLLDEPDAHLEILRQRQIYELLSQTAEESGSQLIAASHSEVLLESAARQDVVIAFVGKSPHRMNDGKRSEVLQSLREYGYAHYYQVEQTGWVLYVEGETDLAILKTFAETLDHPAAECLARPFVQYTANQPSEARRHFNALREAKKDLVGLALFDRLEKELNAKSPLVERMWRKREIENYFCKRGVLMAYAGQMPKVETLWAAAEKEMRLSAMQKAMDKTVEALHTLGKPDPWSDDIKASDDFLVPLFNNFSDNLDLPNQARLTEADFHQLARLVPKEEIDPEIVEKLDAIVEVAQSARPA